MQTYDTIRTVLRLRKNKKAHPTPGLRATVPLPTEYVKFDNASFGEKNELIDVQGHSRSSTLVPIESPLCNFLLVINSIP